MSTALDGDPIQEVPAPEEINDVVIISAGPTGLFAAFYAGMREMKTKIIEALPQVGGQLNVLYPEKFIYDAPGHYRILAKDLVKELKEQAMRFNPTLCLDEQVQELAPLDGQDVICLDTSERQHYTRSVVIAGGIGAFSPNRLRRPGTEKFEGGGVYYTVKDKARFRGKKLLIVGGGDSAVDWALNLKDYARDITLIHRREGFRAVSSSVTELFESDVNVKQWHELKEVHGNSVVEGATLIENRSDYEEYLDVDAVLIFIGFKADMGPIKKWGLETTKRRIVVNGRMETNVPGVYAAGDITEPQGSEQLSLIATGYGQGARAVNFAATHIDPEARVKPGHSSEMKL